MHAVETNKNVHLLFLYSCDLLCVFSILLLLKKKNIVNSEFVGSPPT